MIRSRVFFIFVLLVFIMSQSLTAVEKVDRGQILGYDEDWQSNYDAYEIDGAVLEKIKSAVGVDLRIDVYLGLWCIDSKNNVPKFIKIIDTIGPENLSVNYFSVEREDKQDTQYFVPELKVERVPTFIFYRDGKEIGRIIENPEKSMIEDFLNILL